MSKRTGKTYSSDSSTTKYGKQKVEWKGYVTFELQKSDKAAMAKAVESGNDPITWLPKILAEGVYVLKTSWDTYNNCWVSNLYCQKAGHANAGWSLPARAADMFESMRRVAFVHVSVLDGQWGSGEDTSRWTDENW